MSSSSSQTPPESTFDAYRLRGLHAALAATGRAGRAYLELHPDGESVTQVSLVEPVDWVQWDELEALEAAGPGPAEGARDGERSPSQFFLRRRELDRRTRWTDVQRRLGPAWQRALALDASELRERMVDLGLEMCVFGAAGLGRDELRDWLRPLGSDLAPRVVERLMQHEQKVPGPVGELARQALAEAGAQRGEELLLPLGRRALAASFLRLPQDLRSAARQSARCNLCNVLEDTEPLVPVTDGRVDALDQVIEATFEDRGGRR